MMQVRGSDATNKVQDALFLFVNTFSNEEGGDTHEILMHRKKDERGSPFDTIPSLPGASMVKALGVVFGKLPGHATDEEHIYGSDISVKLCFAPKWRDRSGVTHLPVFYIVEGLAITNYGHVSPREYMAHQLSLLIEDGVWNKREDEPLQWRSYRDIITKSKVSSAMDSGIGVMAGKYINGLLEKDKLPNPYKHTPQARGHQQGY